MVTKFDIFKSFLKLLSVICYMILLCLFPYYYNKANRIIEPIIQEKHINVKSKIKCFKLVGRSYTSMNLRNSTDTKHLFVTDDLTFINENINRLDLDRIEHILISYENDEPDSFTIKDVVIK